MTPKNIYIKVDPPVPLNERFPSPNGKEAVEAEVENKGEPEPPEPSLRSPAPSWNFAEVYLSIKDIDDISFTKTNDGRVTLRPKHGMASWTISISESEISLLIRRLTKLYEH